MLIWRVISVLDAVALRSWAHQLRAAAALMVQEEEAAEVAAARLHGLGFGGDAAVAALRLALAYARQWQQPRSDLRRVAVILEQAALLQEQLNVAIAVADRVSEHSIYAPVVESLYLFIRAHADALDRATAEAVAGLPVSSLPSSVQLGHEHLLAGAAPHIRDLVAEHPDLTLLHLPHGGLVAAVGDLNTARDIVTFVPGTGSGDPASWPTQVAHARSLAESVEGAAVIWIGYDPPPTVVAAIDPGPARIGGALLAQFQRELEATYPAATKTVVGYSYGAVVAGQAAQRRHVGLVADHVVFVGAPGVGAASAAELELVGKDSQVHALTLPGDAITLTTAPGSGVHGPDPASPGFGAEVWPPYRFGGHTSYFHDPAFFAEFSRRVAN